MLSVIIAAHNEETVIGSCLDALLAQPGVVPGRVIVSANGCTDRTAEIAASRGVVVLDRPESGKPGALNAADEVAEGFPRIYLDADIAIPVESIARILTRFDDASHPLAVVPRRRVGTARSSWPVRAYFAINERLPVFRKGLFGRGLIALSDKGRARFATFPSMIADDLYVDSQFTDDEKAEAADVEIMVEAPHTTRSLLRRLVRVRRGNAQMRAAADRGELEITVRSSDKWAWLRDVVVPEPRLALAAVPYVAITVLAGLLARRPSGGGEWGRDISTRSPLPDPPMGAE